jgi:hypothetical protein
MTIKDRVRVATSARGDLVRDIRPLDLPVARQHRLPGAPSAHRLMMWLAPVTAAAVVAALAIALVSIRQVRHEPTVTRSGPAVVPVALPTSPPRYYAALDDPVGTAFSDPLPSQPKGPVNVVVGDIRTGKTFATVTPPHGQTFVGLSAAADDRTFVLATASFPLPDGTSSPRPAAWYLLRIAPGAARPATLTALPVPGEPRGTMVHGMLVPPEVDGIALSPDGSELAVLVQNNGSLALTIYSVRTGHAVRTWTDNIYGGFGLNYWGRISNGSLSWLADGNELAFDTGTPVGVNGPLGGGAGGIVFSDVTVRKLDLSRPGHDLLADSTTVFTLAHVRCDTLQLSADGTTALCGRQSSPGATSTASDPEFLAYSLATGASRVLYLLKNGSWALGVADVLWASPDGTTLIGAVNERSEVDGVGPDYSYREVGVITNGHLKPFTAPLHDGPPVAGQIAF